jgi:acyl-CoA hydrolase
MNYNDIYQSKVVTAEEALQQVKSGQEIVCGLLACEPVTLLSQLHTIKDRVEEVSVVHANMLGEYEFFMNPEMP